MSSINVTIIHQFQSPTGQNFPHIPHIPQCRWTHKAVRAGPRRARSTTVRVRASTGGEVVTSRLTDNRPMRIDLEADEPVQASAVASCRAIVLLSQDVRRKTYETDLQIRSSSCALQQVLAARLARPSSRLIEALSTIFLRNHYR